MVTIMVLFCLLLVLSFIAAVVMGLVAISPWILLIISLPLIDYFVLKMVFKRKKKK